MNAERQPSAQASPTRARRDLVWMLLGLAAFVLLGLGVIFFSDPGGMGLAWLRKAPAAASALELTLVHSNDTWGYIETCGG